ncbi:MAG: cohesin domain-containing protein, partial [Bacteroidota bacterium]
GSSNDVGANRDSDAAINGVTIGDAFDIVRHTLLIDPFTTAPQYIAADVNANQTINVLDAFAVIRRVLGLRTSFDNPQTGAPGAIWTFYPTDHVFADPTNPWGYPTRRNFNSPSPVTGQDFFGVKLGDVNADWNPNGLRPMAQTDSIQFVMDAVMAQADQYVTVPVRVKDFNNIAGYQFTLQWDANVLEFESVSHAALEGMYNTQEAHNGMIAAAWIDLAGQGLSLQDGELAFELTFRVVGQLGSKTDFHMSSAITTSNAINDVRTNLGIGVVSSPITVGGTSTNIDPLALAGYGLNNSVPNPFMNGTTLNFSVGQPETVEIAIYNVAGQVVRSFQGRYAAGDHQLEWDGRSANGTEVSEGMYFVRMKAGEFNAAVRVQKLN